MIPRTRVMCSSTESTNRKKRKEWGKGRKGTKEKGSMKEEGQGGAEIQAEGQE